MGSLTFVLCDYCRPFRHLATALVAYFIPLLTVETLEDEIRYIWVSRGLKKDRSGNDLATRSDTAAETLIWKDRLSLRKLSFGPSARSQGI